MRAAAGSGILAAMPRPPGAAGSIAMAATTKAPVLPARRATTVTTIAAGMATRAGIPKPHGAAGRIAAIAERVPPIRAIRRRFRKPLESPACFLGRRRRGRPAGQTRANRFARHAKVRRKARPGYGRHPTRSAAGARSDTRALMAAFSKLGQFGSVRQCGLRGRVCHAGRWVAHPVPSVWRAL